MSELTDEQKAEIRAYLDGQSDSDALAPSQKWEVAKIVGGLILGFAAVLGLGGAYLVTESADKAARSWTISDLAAKVTDDEKFLERLDRIIPFPRGVVAAFDIEAGCPIGWAPFKDAFGRFLLGAGGQKGGPIARSFREIGGEESHLLTVDEMPKHQHIVEYHNKPVTMDTTKTDKELWLFESKTGDGHAGSAFIAQPRDGQELAHNNMPPYIALHFCKYEGKG